MKIEIERVTDWKRVVNAARFTVGKAPIDHEPSLKFKKAIVFAEHSPIRLIEYDVRITDVPKYVVMHLVRHHQGIEKFVSTSRPDRNAHPIPRHEQRADDLVNCQFSLNAQAFINISRVRLCGRAEKATRNLWRQVVNALKDIDPVVASACVPNCIYRFICPEHKCCGYNESTIGLDERRLYLSYFKEFLK